jgi:hypothetical protein
MKMQCRTAWMLVAVLVRRFDPVTSSAKYFPERGDVNVGRNILCGYWNNPSASWADGSVLPWGRS